MCNYCRPEPSGMARAERDYLTPLDLAEPRTCDEETIPGYAEFAFGEWGGDPWDLPCPRTLDAILADCPEEG